MSKKTLLIVLTLLALIFISTVSFANNDIKNDVHSVTDTAIDGAGRLGNDVKNGIGTAAGSIENGAKNLGNTVSQGMQNIGNAVSDGMQDVGNTVSESSQTLTGTDNNGYTATRTTASDITNTDIMNSNLWTWVTIAIAGAVIVGLVWYYAVEHDTER